MARSTTSSNPKPASRAWDVATHVAPLVVAIVAAIAVGKPLGWIAFLFPLGPILVGLVTRAVGRDLPRGFRSAVVFSIVSGLLIGLGWVGMLAGAWFSPLALVFPFALLVFAVGLLNWLLIVVSRTIRAVKFQAFDYPWIPDRLARLVGLPKGWSE